MKQGTKSQGTSAPDRLAARKLPSGAYELYLSIDAGEVEVQGHDGGTATAVEWTSYFARSTASTYDELVPDLIHLLYSLDDEVALGYKDDSDEEKVAYRSYVAECKAFAKTLIAK